MHARCCENLKPRVPKEDMTLQASFTFAAYASSHRSPTGWFSSDL